MNRVTLFLGAAAIALAIGTPQASWAADRWEGDDNPWQAGGSENELTGGTVQDHDMEGAADEDWMVLSQRPFSSYEVRIDGFSDGLTYTGTGDTIAVDLVESDGTSVSTGYNNHPLAIDRHITFANDTATANNEQHIRVSSPNCNPCSAAGSGYTVRMFDTTYSIPRFNNTASQVTFLILNNNLDRSVSVTEHFFGPTGTLLASNPTSINAHGTAVINTSTIGGLAGQSGAVTITSSGGYGSLSGKGVALEPGTGFTFDTMMVLRQP